jgi:putative addiction module component (TIGR02574 family)
MAVGLEQLALELLGLPAKSRARLAEQLIASLEEDEVPDVDDVAIETAKRCAEELAEGKVQGIPAEEVMRRARGRLK